MAFECARFFRRQRPDLLNDRTFLASEKAGYITGEGLNVSDGEEMY